MTLKLSALAAFILLFVSACAAGSEASHTAAHGSALYQLIVGLWHGFIAPFTLIGEIINTIAPRTLPWTFRMYEVENGGSLYDLGFFVGLFGGPSVLWSGSRRRVIAR
jgi:hypothetical protein